MKTKTVCLLAVMGTLLGAAGAYVIWPAAKAGRSLQDLDAKSATRLVRRDLRERMIEYHATVSDVLKRAHDVTATLNQHDLKQVGIAAKFAMRAVQDDYDSVSLSSRTRGELNLLLGLSSLVYQEYHQARDAFAETSADFAESLQAFTDPQVLLSRASALNALCCVNAQMGLLAEAEVAANEAMEVAFQLQSFDGAEEASSFERAHSLRSLAIIAAIKGQPAVQYAIESLQAAEAVPVWSQSETGRISFERPYFALDCHLLVAQLHSLIGDVDAAQKEIQNSIQRMEELQNVLDRVSGREEYPGMSLRLRRLRYYLNQQLATLTERAAKSNSHRSVAGQYLWIPMRYQPARSLHSDMLFNGNVAGEFENQDSMALLYRDQGWEHNTVISVACHLSSRVLTRVFVSDENSSPDVLTALRNGGARMDNIRVRVLPTDSIWIRDFGPIYAVSPGNQTVFIDGVYGPNAIDDYRCNDEVLPERMARIWDMPNVRTSLFIQGGEILVNGSGLCLVSQSLLDRNVLRGLSRDFIVESLKRTTGASDVIVLESLIDELTGHVDWFATFTSATTVFIGSYSDSSDPNAAVLDRNAALLDGVITKQGPLKVVRIPMPPRQQEWFGGSYTNVAYANGMLLLPTWDGAPADQLETVKAAYREALPSWEIVTVPSDVLGEQQGAIHCMTLGLPVLNPLFD